MAYGARLILYYLNWVAILFAGGGMVYSLAMIVLGDRGWREGWVPVLIFFLVLIGSGFLFVVRKSIVPVAGKDYR